MFTYSDDIICYYLKILICIPSVSYMRSSFHLYIAGLQIKIYFMVSTYQLYFDQYIKQ